MSFHQREVIADAHARARAERHVRAAWKLLLLVTEETLGLEGLGPRKHIGPAMDAEDAHDNDRILRELVLADDDVFERATPDDVRRRVEAHRFFEDGKRVWQSLEILVGRRCGQRVDLGLETRTRLGIA